MGQITTTREIDIDLTTVIAEGQIEVKDLLNWIKEYYEGTVTDLIFWDLTRANVSPISDSGFAELFDALRDRDEIRAWGKTALVFGDESLSFDEALAKLEELAGHLEEGDVPLEEALEIYESAVHLFSFCRQRLDGMEQRIEQLAEAMDGTLSTEPLEVGNDDAENG